MHVKGQFLKASLPIVSISISRSSSKYVLIPIVVTLVGIVTDTSDEQSKKASSSIVVTLSGIVTDVSDVHS